MYTAIYRIRELLAEVGREYTAMDIEMVVHRMMDVSHILGPVSLDIGDGFVLYVKQLGEDTFDVQLWEDGLGEEMN